jgi:predicted dehydrogenase/nucleoside-diphosphate-sugar epimerase
MNSQAEAAPLRVAVLGGGAVTRILYLPALATPEVEVQVRCIVDPSRTALDALAPELPTETTLISAGFESLYGDSKMCRELDGVVVALPHHLHEAAVVGAFEHGLHVFCEKPLTLDGASLERIRHASRQAGRVLAVCQPRRRMPIFRALKHIAGRKLFGEFRRGTWIEGNAYNWPAESLSQVLAKTGGEMLYDIGAHIFDCLSWWLGDLRVDSYRDDSTGGAAANYEIGLKTPSGADVNVRMSRLFDLGAKIQLEFERGVVECSPHSPTTLRVHSDWSPFPEIEVALTKEPLDFVTVFADELRDFSRLARGVANDSVAIDDAARTVSLFDQCHSLRDTESRAPRIAIKSSARRIVVTGAGGFIGGRVAELCLVRGMEVTGLVHRPQSSVRIARTVADIRQANICHEDTLAAEFAEADAVVHCAYGGPDEHALAASVVEGSACVLRAALRARVRRTVLLGSMLAYGDPPASGTVDERYSQFLGADAYGAAKRTMADQSLSFAREHGQSIIVLEPTCVFGAYGRDFGTTYLNQMGSGDFALVEKGRGLANLIHCDNLADAILTSVDSASLPSGRYLLNEDEWMTTWRDYFLPLWRLFSMAEPPSFTRMELEHVRRSRRRDARPWNLLRSAIRSHRPARERISKSQLFRLWKLARRGAAAQSTIASNSRKMVQGQSARRSRDKRSAEATSPMTFDLASLKHLPSDTFVGLFDNQAHYVSSKFREATGWRPKVDRTQAIQTTVAWAECFVRGAELTFPLVKRCRSLDAFPTAMDSKKGSHDDR